MKPTLLLCASTALMLGLMPTAIRASATDQSIAQTAEATKLKDFRRSPTTLKDWLAQIEESEVKSQALAVQVIRVQLERTDTGLEIILETAENKLLQVDATQFRTDGNDLIATIPNALLALPESNEFRVENPTAGIATVQITQVDAATIQVRVAGENALPTTEVRLRTGDLRYSLNPQADEPDEEIVVTGEGQRGYRAPNATTATKTDTPLRDIPQSIQVIPKQVLEDRNATELRDALETLGGISSGGGRGSGGAGEILQIRGFSITGSILRDGIPIFSQGTLDSSDVEQIEVLRGPASVLFGSGEPGGIINLVSKQPLSEPYYAASFTIGSFNTYRGTIDFSGPLNESKTVKYRLNASYENYGSFRNSVNGDRFSITPTLTWDISPDTTFNIYGQFITERETIDDGLPETSAGVVDLPRSRFLNEGFGDFEQEQFNLGYTLNHRFGDDWSVRHALQYLQFQPQRYYPFFDSFDETTGELSRIAYAATGTYRRFFTNAEVVGKFNTGSVQHKLLFGVEYRYLAEDPSFQFSNSYPSINVFNPIYTRTRYDIAPEFFRDDNVNVFSVYLQDQVDLLPNLKLLAGIRYDNFSQFRTTQDLGQPRNEFEQTDSAWSPRVGIVYQPIQALSLYASYTQSFAPSFAASRNADGSTFDPETGQQFEVGIKADLSDRLSLTLAAFDLKRQNLSTPDPTNPIFSLQVGEQTSRGIELNLAGELLTGWNVTASYTYLDAFVSKDNSTPIGNRLPDVPENQIGLWTTYEIQAGNLKGLGFGLGLFYVGERQRDLDNTYSLPSYFRTDAALYYRRGNWRVQLNIENLFDVEYFRSGNYSFVGSGVNPGKPFAVSGTISIEF